jgi:hypothetical protein
VSVDVILKALAKNRVYVQFLDLNKTTESTEDITYIQIFSTFDERDSRDKSKKTSFGMKEGAKKGKILCTDKIYGYKYYPNPENRLEIIPEQAEIVKRMFEMYVDGIGAYRIAKILFDEGVLNKSGEPFREYSIRRILSNEKYCGIVARMKYDTGEVFNKHSYARIRPLEERKEYQFVDEKRMPKIIEPELFYKAQVMRESRQQHITQIGKNKGVNYGTTPYAGKIKCGSCGTQYRAFQTKYYEGRPKPERYFCCVGKQGIDISKRCKNPNLSQTFLDNELRSEKYTELLAESFLTAQRFLAELQNDLRLALNDKSASERLARLKVEQNEYQAKIDKGVGLYLDGTIDKESVERQLAPIRKKNDTAKAKIDELEKPKNEKLYDIFRISDTMSELKRRLGEIYEFEMITGVDVAEDGTLVFSESEFVDGFGIFNIDYSKPPKRQFTKEEILKDIDFITVTSGKYLIVNFKTFAEVEQLVTRHEDNMTVRTRGIFEELKEVGWNRSVCYKHYDFWFGISLI